LICTRVYVLENKICTKLHVLEKLDRHKKTCFREVTVDMHNTACFREVRYAQEYMLESRMRGRSPDSPLVGLPAGGRSKSPSFPAKASFQLVSQCMGCGRRNHCIVHYIDVVYVCLLCI
jgi:hypothetical protein